MESHSEFAAPPSEISGPEVAAEVSTIVARFGDDAKLCLKERQKTPNEKALRRTKKEAKGVRKND